MIVERVLLTLKPGAADDFPAVFAKARGHLEGANGFVRLEMRRGIENPDSYLLIVWWRTLEDHIKGFRESEAFVQWRALLGPLFAAPPAVEHYAEPL